MQDAIDAAEDGATITICAGVYNENLNIDQDITIIGAGAGDSDEDTIIQGTGTTSVVTTGGNVSLQDLRIAGGAANSGGGIHNGGPCASCTSTQLCRDETCQDCDVCASGCAFATLLAAIDAANAGDTITICAGSYDEHVTIGQDLTIIGAGDGGGGTVLQGTGNGSVVTVSAGSSADLQHLRITGGAADHGGGVFSAGALSMTGRTVTGNSAEFTGGGMYHGGSSLTMTNSTISGNTGGGDGGGVFNDTTTELIGCTVSGNTSFYGSGIYNESGALALIDCEISGNTASYGGGLYNIDTVTLDADSRMTGNTATSGGGGILNFTGGSVSLASEQNVTGNTPNNCAGFAVPMCIDY